MIWTIVYYHKFNEINVLRAALRAAASRVAGSAVEREIGELDDWDARSAVEDILVVVVRSWKQTQSAL